MTCQTPDRSGFPSGRRGMAAAEGACAATGAKVTTAAAITDRYPTVFTESLPRLLLLWIVRCAGARGSGEEISSIRKLHRLAVSRGRAILGAIALNDYFETLRKIGLSQTSPQERIRAAEFNGPTHYLAVF